MQEMEEELNDIIWLLGNPTRRRILEHLARERNYAIQLAREMDMSQQAVAKQLRMLEDRNMIYCEEETSTTGPPHKTYIAKRHISVTMNVGPNLFTTDVQPFETVDVDDKQVTEMLAEVDGLREGTPAAFFNALSSRLQDINSEIQELHIKRISFLRAKELLLREGYNLIYSLYVTPEEKHILHFILENGMTEPAEISEHLNVRVKVVVDLIEKLKPKEESIGSSTRQDGDLNDKEGENDEQPKE
jgi:predicted transcriptional regulator